MSKGYKSFSQDIAADGETLFAIDGSFRVKFSGDFGGGTLKLQEKMANNSYVDIEDTSKTAEAGFIVDNFGGNEYKAVLTGATAPAIVLSVKGTLQKVPG